MTNKEMLKCIRDHYGLQRNVDFARHFGISEQLANNWNNSGKLDYIEIYRLCPRTLHTEERNGYLHTQRPP